MSIPQTGINPAIINLLRKVPLFSQLADTNLHKIAQIIKTRKYAAGSLLFQEGDLGDVMYIVVSGKVKIFIERDGKEKIITVFSEGHNFGELALIDGEPRSASAVTVSEAVLITISRNAFVELLRDNFSIVEKVMAEITNRLRKTNNHVNDLLYLDAKTQVIKMLVQLATTHGNRISPDIVHIELNLTNEELSKHTGISPEVVGFVMQYLQEKKIVTAQNGAFFINTKVLAVNK